jgi:hypothetical protein
MRGGNDHQAALGGPAEVAVDAGAQGGGVPVVVADGGGPADGEGHAALRGALGAADFGRVDGGAGPAHDVDRGQQ